MAPEPRVSEYVTVENLLEPPRDLAEKKRVVGREHPKMQQSPGRAGARALSPENYRTDPMFPRIQRGVLGILSRGNVVAPVDVLVAMDALDVRDLEAWRLGRVPFLERKIRGNLSKLRRFLRILGFLCHDLNLKGSHTAYVRWGKGARPALRFTKTGEPRLEDLYSRHFVWPGKIPFHLPR